MRTRIAVSTFVLIGAGTVGAGAVGANNIQFKGSDTLFEVTKDVLANCIGADPAPGDQAPPYNLPYDGNGLGYLGGGSGAGEGNLKSGAQASAPMSRFLQGGNSCGASQTTAEGLVVGLDGVAIIGAQSTIDAGACNPGTADCDATTVPTTGAAFSTTITDASLPGGSYTFNNWRDVLRVLYAGLDHNGGSAIGNRNCNSPVRRYVANHWNAFFQNNCTSGSCTQIQHAFRRDDSSGTTDTVTAVLGLTTQNVGTLTSPFCNAVQGSEPFPTFHNKNAGGDTTWNAGNPLDHPDFQDNDPIRHTCKGTNSGDPAPIEAGGTEQVCGRLGSLGLVLPIQPPSTTATVAYPTKQCVGSLPFVFLQAPRLPGGKFWECPNGDSPVLFGNNCQGPTAADGDRACLGDRTVKPTFLTCGTALDPCPTPLPSTADGRVYGLYVRNGGTGATAGNMVFDKGRPITGAFYRMHTTRSAIPGAAGTHTCTDPDATAQIGCLVGANPCSIGYAGKEASTAVGAEAIKVAALDPTTECIQPFKYPFSRKLYFNTLAGFSNIAASQELELAKCEATTAKIDAAILAHGFVLTPADVTDGFAVGQPYCEDFNDGTLCSPNAVNTNACGNNVGTFPGATGSTVCGNASVEKAEECDDGATPIPPTTLSGGNSVSPAKCSTACRLNAPAPPGNCAYDVAGPNPLACATSGGGILAGQACANGATAGTCVSTPAGCACQAPAGNCKQDANFVCLPAGTPGGGPNLGDACTGGSGTNTCKQTAAGCTCL